MKTITAVKPQKRNSERVNVYLDGLFAFGVSARLAQSLAVGQELPESKIQHLQELDEYKISLQMALDQIGRRPRTEQEIRQYLRKKGREGASDAVVSRLKELQYLDDEAFARQWIEDRLAFRPRSSMALRYELRRKGIAGCTIDAVLEGFDDQSAAVSAARTAVRKLWKQEPEKRRKKIYGYLSRRGFRYEEIRTAVEQVMSEEEEQNSDPFA